MDENQNFDQENQNTEENQNPVENQETTNETYQPTNVTTPGVDDGKNWSIAALVLGIVGIVGGYIPIVTYFTLIAAILGIVFGVKGRKLSVAAYGKASGLATAGLVLGIIGTAFAALGVICVGICGAALCAAGSAGALAGY